MAAFKSDLNDVRFSILLYLMLLSLSLILLIIVTVTEEPISVRGEIAFDIAFALITLAWCAAYRKDVLPPLKTSPRPVWILVAMFAGVGTYIVASSAVGLLHLVFDLEEIRYLENFELEGYSPWWGILQLSVFPAIFEELAFRGVILAALCRALKPREAMLVDALMFAILHLDVASMPHLFLIGYLLCWLRLRTGSLYPAMVMHFMHNLLVGLSEYNETVLPW